MSADATSGRGRWTETLLRRPRVVLLVAGLFVVVALVAIVLTPDRLGVGGFTDPDAESAEALTAMQRELGYDPEPGMIVVASRADGFDSATAKRDVARLARTIEADPAVGSVETAFDEPPLPLLLSRDGDKTLLLVHFRSADPDELAEPIERLREGLKPPPNAEIAIGGFAVGFQDVSGAARHDLVRAELIAFPLLALLLLLFFRGLTAAAVPLLIGGAAVAGTVACLRLLSSTVGLSVFALNQAVLLGLGLAVDYGLLLVSRFREEAVAHGPGEHAIRRTMATAGRTVAFSGCAVAGACAGLLLFPVGFLYSMGIAGIVVSLSAAAAALTITPPLLLLAGHRIGASSPKETTTSGWYRLSHWVMRRRVDVALLGTAVLLAAAAPTLLLEPTFAEYDATPRGYESRAVSETIQTDFSPYLGRPISVLANLEGSGRSPDAVVATLNALEGVAGFRTLPSRTSTTLVIQLLPAQPSLSPRVQQAVKDARELPAPLLVGGRTAEFVDLKDTILSRAPPALALVALTSLAVLFAMTGSLLLPLKGLLFNVLTIGASFGLVVLIFQEGALGIADLLAYDGPSAIEITTCAVIVALTFGLASDYSVLMLSRISEEHAKGTPDEEAIARGMQRSGPVITRAAILIAVALLALASSEIFLVKQLAVGQALAIAIDVTLVRVLLVPALMRIMGPANWWAPGPLRRLRYAKKAY
jgi:RND superfamily putative drug exporter